MDQTTSKMIVYDSVQIPNYIYLGNNFKSHFANSDQKPEKVVVVKYNLINLEDEVDKKPNKKQAQKHELGKVLLTTAMSYCMIGACVTGESKPNTGILSIVGHGSTSFTGII